MYAYLRRMGVPPPSFPIKPFYVPPPQPSPLFPSFNRFQPPLSFFQLYGFLLKFSLYYCILISFHVTI